MPEHTMIKIIMSFNGKFNDKQPPFWPGSSLQVSQWSCLVALSPPQLRCLVNCLQGKTEPKAWRKRLGKGFVVSTAGFPTPRIQCAATNMHMDGDTLFTALFLFVSKWKWRDLIRTSHTENYDDPSLVLTEV